MRFSLRPANLPLEYPRIAELLNANVSKSVTPEDLAREDNGMPPGSVIAYSVALDETGRIVGYCKAHRYPNTPPTKSYIYLAVDPAVRGQGAGALLLTEVERLAAVHGCTYLLGEVRDNDPNSRTFMEKRGYQIKRHGFYSTLDLTTWDGAPFAGVIEQVQAGGVRFTTLDTLPNGEQRLYALMARTMEDLPGYEATAFMSFETFMNFLVNPSGPANVIVAVDGDELVGVTFLEPMEGGDFYTPHTSVLRTYRGRRIALALKLQAIAKARQLGAQKMTTGNDSLNQPMLAVNQRLGYIASEGAYDMAKYR